ncbi:MAG: hypothetical protein RLZZ179_3072 [Verrucomicrobiota bacterium]|jgi:hypothetical protein
MSTQPERSSGEGKPSGAASKRRGEILLERQRRRILAEWRGVYVPPDLSGYERKVGDLVQRVLRRVGLPEQSSHEQMAAQWESLVGPFLAAQSRPTALRRGVLEVSVTQSAVRYELERQWKRKVLARLQETFGRDRVKDVRFIPG